MSSYYNLGSTESISDIKIKEVIKDYSELNTLYDKLQFKGKILELINLSDFNSFDSIYDFVKDKSNTNLQNFFKTFISKNNNQYDFDYSYLFLTVSLLANKYEFADYILKNSSVKLDLHCNLILKLLIKNNNLKALKHIEKYNQLSGSDLFSWFTLGLYPNWFNTDNFLDDPISAFRIAIEDNGSSEMFIYLLEQFDINVLDNNLLEDSHYRPFNIVDVLKEDKPELLINLKDNYYILDKLEELKDSIELAKKTDNKQLEYKGLIMLKEFIENNNYLQDSNLQITKDL